MRYTKEMFQQFSRPHGFWGMVAGTIMLANPSNRARNLWTMDLLEIEPQHRVLEIGFGPGFALAHAAQRANRGTVTGLDHSETMLRQAAKRNARAIAEGRMILRLGSVLDAARLDGPFDRIYAVNSAQFWPEPLQRFRDLRKLLREGGRIAITHQPRNAGATDQHTQESAARTGELLRAAGFVDVRSAFKKLKPVPAACVLAQNPGD